MRALDIPARVVTGYQGGEINPVDGFLEVRQRDAHAWAEVWIAGEGWVRVDPTAAVAPDRIERGAGRGDRRASQGFALDGSFLSSLVRSTRFNWDAVGNAWNQWVLAYNADRQSGLFERTRHRARRLADADDRADRRVRRRARGDRRVRARHAARRPIRSRASTRRLARCSRAPRARSGGGPRRVERRRSPRVARPKGRARISRASATVCRRRCASGPRPRSRRTRRCATDRAPTAIDEGTLRARFAASVAGLRA